MIALKQHRVSERRACAIARLHRSTFRTVARPRRDDSRIRRRMQEMSAHPYRRGFPWMLQRLRKEGIADNHKRLHRIYKEARLQMPRKQPKQRHRGPEVARVRAEHLNHIWCADFISDSTQNNRTGRILNLLDEHSRYSIDMLCSTSIPGRRVEEVLERAIAYRGSKPEVLVVDNGPEFICNLLEIWAERRGVRIHFIGKGKPTQNCFIESFHAILRREFLNKQWFINVAEMERGVLGYRRYYNEDREHSSLGWMTPAEYEEGLLSASSPTAPRPTRPEQQPTV